MRNELGASWISHDLVQHTTNLLNDKTSSRHIAKVKTIAQSLESKGYIKIVEDEDRYMRVEYIDRVNKNFTKVCHSEFERLNNPYDLYTYVSVKKWEKGAVYPYSIWCGLLGVKEKRAIAIIKDAIERKVIYKMDGNWNGMNSKDPNTYSTKPFVKKLSELEETAVAEEKSPVVQKIIEEEKVHDVLSIAEHNHQWFNKQRTDYTVDDFVVYLTTDDKKIITAAEKAIARVSKSDKGKWIMENLRSEAEAQIKRDAQKFEEAKEQELEPVAQQMIEESKDIVLLVDDVLIKYADYDKSSPPQKVFFYQVTDIQGHGYAPMFEIKNNPSNIEKYRKENGEWKHEWQL
ncbi:hypothetical protein [Bacillus sp. 37MA]|nr:hypothetical protein [Bacillus sp. 37MA]